MFYERVWQSFKLTFTDQQPWNFLQVSGGAQVVSFSIVFLSPTALAKSQQVSELWILALLSSQATKRYRKPWKLLSVCWPEKQPHHLTLAWLLQHTCTKLGCKGKASRIILYLPLWLIVRRLILLWSVALLLTSSSSSVLRLTWLLAN